MFIDYTKGSYGHNPAAVSSCRKEREEARGPWSRVSTLQPQSPGHTHCPTEDLLLNTQTLKFIWQIYILENP